MMTRPKRRFGKPFERGKMVSVRTRKRYVQFHWKLAVLNHYFDSWLLPREPEEATMTRVILALQDILERETEFAIAVEASRSPNRKDRDFHSNIQRGYGSFKSKFEWLFNKDLISGADKNVMEEIRRIRNEH